MKSPLNSWHLLSHKTTSKVVGRQLVRGLPKMSRAACSAACSDGMRRQQDPKGGQSLDAGRAEPEQGDFDLHPFLAPIALRRPWRKDLRSPPWVTCMKKTGHPHPQALVAKLPLFRHGIRHGPQSPPDQTPTTATGGMSPEHVYTPGQPHTGRLLPPRQQVNTNDADAPLTKLLPLRKSRPLLSPQGLSPLAQALGRSNQQCQNEKPEAGASSLRTKLASQMSGWSRSALCPRLVVMLKNHSECLTTLERAI